jgi:hypothetical protein
LIRIVRERGITDDCREEEEEGIENSIKKEVTKTVENKIIILF